MSASVDEVERVRAEYEGRIAHMKKQHADSKAKAKAVILMQKEDANRRIAGLEEDVKLRSDELAQLKDMLRLAEDEKSALIQQGSVLKTEISRLKQDNFNFMEERDKALSQLADVREESHRLKDDATKENDRLLRELLDAKQKLESSKTPPNSQAAETPSTDPSQLQDTNTELVQNDTKIFQLLSELSDVKSECRDLSRNLEEARAKFSEETKAHESFVADSNAKKAELETHLAEAREELVEKHKELTKTKEILQQQQNMVKDMSKEKINETDAASNAEKKVLEAKVAEMERLVASKQAECTKVREKARAYLKELNAERRTMEEKTKEEVDALKKQLENAQEKASDAETRFEGATKEVDNCLVVIREKQKSVQMLKMSISTQEKAAQEARRETESLKLDFARYKERARLALEEKESAVVSSNDNGTSDTTTLLTDLKNAKLEIHNLRRRLQTLQSLEKHIEELRIRAERAEAVADLLRKDSSVATSSTNYSRVDELEETIAQLEQQLNATQVAVTDVEARHSTTKIRLEATEKALQNADTRAKNAALASQKTVDSLQGRINDLESSLKRAQEAAASAQRTAAAAAKALVYSATEVESGIDATNTTMDFGNNTGDRDYNLDEEINGSRSTLAAVMESHSDRLGLSPRAKAESPRNYSENPSNEGSSDFYLQTKEQQIAVLSSQLEELGALLEEVQLESDLKAEQTEALKREVKNLDAKLAAAEKLHNGAPFSYLRAIVVRYLETDDTTLLPVICSVLSFSDEETSRIKEFRGSKTTGSTSSNTKGGYFSLPFIGSR